MVHVLCNYHGLEYELREENQNRELWNSEMMCFCRLSLHAGACAGQEESEIIFSLVKSLPCCYFLFLPPKKLPQPLLSLQLKGRWLVAQCWNWQKMLQTGSSARRPCELSNWGISAARLRPELWLILHRRIYFAIQPLGLKHRSPK